MRGVSHLALGAAASGALALSAGLPTEAASLLVAGSLPGSLLPDADHRRAMVYSRSKLERSFFPLAVVLTLVRGVLRVFTLGRQRGALHSPLAILVCLYGIYSSPAMPAIAGVLTIGFAIGYLVHLAADGLTVDGLSAFPLSGRWWLCPRFLRFRTGAWPEHVVVIVSVLGLALLLYGCGSDTPCSPERSAALAVASEYGLDQRALLTHPPTPAGVVFVALGDRRWQVAIDGCKASAVNPQAPRLR